MADIQKCDGVRHISEAHVTICPKREQCYRYTAPANRGWQSYGPAPFELVDGQTVCRDFWNVNER